MMLGMFTFHKGDCEHCWRTYRYTLWQAGFGDFSYAYCDSCGMLATFAYSNKNVLNLPPLSARHQVIDAEWEPFAGPCACGGHFRTGASPRCPYCHLPLSAEYAASHIERNSVGAAKGWRWQRSWSDLYCMAIEDPADPGNLRQMVDPFLPSALEPVATKAKWRWGRALSLSR
jgi:hypothetical protein